LRYTTLAISTITVREVRKGIMKLRSKNREVADQIEVRALGLFDAFGERVLPITCVVADLWGELLAESDKHVDDTGLVATARDSQSGPGHEKYQACDWPRRDAA
jgi:hypothetical protein